MSCERAKLPVPSGINLTDRALDYAHLKQCPECRQERDRLREHGAVAMTMIQGGDPSRALRQGIDWTIATISSGASSVATELTKFRVPRPPALPVAAVARDAMRRVRTTPARVRVLAPSLARPVAHCALALGRGTAAATTAVARRTATLGLAVAAGVAGAARVVAAAAHAGALALGRALLAIGGALERVGGASLVIGRAAWSTVIAAARSGVRLAAESGASLLALGAAVARAGAVTGRATGRALLGGSMAILAGLGWIGLGTVATGRAAASVLSAGGRGAAGVFSSMIVLGAAAGLNGSRVVTAGGIALGRRLAIWISQLGRALQTVSRLAGHGLARLGEVLDDALRVAARTGATAARGAGVALAVLAGAASSVGIDAVAASCRGVGQLAAVGRAGASRAAALPGHVARVQSVARTLARRTATGVAERARAVGGGLAAMGVWVRPLLKPAIAVTGLAILGWSLAAVWPPRAQMAPSAPSRASVETAQARRPVTPDPGTFTAPPTTVRPMITEPAPAPQPAPASAAIRATLPEHGAEAPAPRRRSEAVPAPVRMRTALPEPGAEAPAPRRRAEAVPPSARTRATVPESSDAEDASAAIDWLLKGGGSRGRVESP